VFNFFFHRALNVSAERSNRVRRAGVRSRSHGSNVGAFENEESSRCGAAAAWSDVNDYWNRGGEGFLHNLAHCVHPPARRAQFDENGVILLGSSLIESALDPLGSGGLDSVVQYDLQDVGVSKTGKQANQNGCRNKCAKAHVPTPEAELAQGYCLA